MSLYSGLQTLSLLFLRAAKLSPPGSASVIFIRSARAPIFISLARPQVILCSPPDKEGRLSLYEKASDVLPSFAGQGGALFFWPIYPEPSPPSVLIHIQAYWRLHPAILYAAQQVGVDRGMIKGRADW